MLTEKFVQTRKEKGEVVGGGFFIFRRGKKTGRIGCKSKAIPFEHGSLESAMGEAMRLAETNQGEEFAIVHEIMKFRTEKDETS